MTEKIKYAPGWPGIPARWTSSAKSGVGTSLSPASPVWFSLSHGIFNEIYYPDIDAPCTRDMGLIITDGKGYFSEEKRHAGSRLTYPSEGVPAYHLENRCVHNRYLIKKDILTDSKREVVLQRTEFVPTQGRLEDYHLYVLLAPHLGNYGSGNTAWLGEYKGVPMLFAERGSVALALACSAPYLKRSVGFVGTSDGWQDIHQHNQMIWEYERAENGNVALTAEIDLTATGGRFVLALAFGRNSAEAGLCARESLLDGFERSEKTYIEGWKAWQSTLLDMSGAAASGHNLYRVSTAVLRTHEAKHFFGGIIASLSIPWGFAKGDNELGGYHLLWTRDLVEAAGGLLAAGNKEDVRRIGEYLMATQESDGRWPQNMWLDGLPLWTGTQMDETAFPILVVGLARKENALSTDDTMRLWPMVQKAAGFLLRNGPVTPQDRWEEDPGYSPFTLSVEIAALLVAAELADLNKEFMIAAYLRETADVWNVLIERWTYARGTDLARRIGVDGYYVRIAPPEVADAVSPLEGFVPIKNRPIGQNIERASEIISPDALALVRFGLRSPDDPRIVNTVKVIDALLKVETPFGPAWHRYNDDGYGERKDGSPFNGVGVGRAWPILTGERAHYELAAGRREEAERLLEAFSAFANDGGMISEQIWDSPDIPARELFFGRPSGSAMPLVWAHAEYIKLLRSLRDGKVFDTPEAVPRYLKTKTETHLAIWRFNHKSRTMPVGKVLRIEVLKPALIHWSADDWKNSFDIEARDMGLGFFTSDLPTSRLQAGGTVKFTFYWKDEKRWEGKDYEVGISVT